MSEDATATDEGTTTGEVEPPTDDVWARQTAPQTPYTSRQVGIGLVLFVAIAVVAFGLPLALP